MWPRHHHFGTRFQPPGVPYEHSKISRVSHHYIKAERYGYIFHDIRALRSVDKTDLIYLAFIVRKLLLHVALYYVVIAVRFHGVREL